MSFDDFIESIASVINRLAKPVLPIIEKYWFLLIFIPLLPLLWAIAHYGFKII